MRISLALMVLAVSSASARSAESGPPVLRKLDSATSLEGLRVETHAGEVGAEATPVVPSDEIIIGFLAQTLMPADAAVLKTKLAALYVPGNQRRNLTFRTLDEGGVVTFGPFTSRAQFNRAIQELIAKIPLEPAGIPASSVEMCDLLQKISPADAGPWASMLLVGRLPEQDPRIEAYLEAYLARMFRGLRLRTSYWSPGGERCTALELVSRETAAPVAPMDPAEILTAPTSEGAIHAEINWPDPRLKEGFRLYRALLKDASGEILGPYTAIAVAAGSTPPEPALFQELRAAATALTEMVKAPEGLPVSLEQARATIQRALAINPRDEEALRGGASILERQGELKEAAALLEALSEMQPRDLDLFGELGDVLFKSQDLSRAELYLLRARELGARKPFISEELGRIAAANGRYREAIPFLEEYLAQDTRNDALWFLRADCSLRIDDFDRAIDSIEHGLELQPERLDYRTRLIQFYLTRKENSKAAIHARFVARNPPGDAEVRAAYARFLEKVATPDEALELWQRTLAIAPGMEKAHIAVTQLLMARGDPAAAEAAARAGIGRCPTAARLYILKADAEDQQDLWQQSRSTLLAGVAASEDIDLLLRHAAVEDRYGLRAAAAYEKLATAMQSGGRPHAERNLALDRGLFVAVRDGDMARAEIFARLLREAGLPQHADLLAARPSEGSREVMVPGGIAAVMRVIGGRESIKAENYFLELSRSLTVETNQAAAKELRDRLAEHFDRIRQIESLGVRTGNRVVLHLSARDRTARRNTERILRLLGWTTESSGSGMKISPAEKRSAAERQITTAALILDDIAMQEALQSGRDFEFAILDDQVPVILGEKSWREAFIGNDTPAGGLSEVFASNPRLGHLYIGLANLDDDTAAGLARDFGLKTLEDQYYKLLYHYSASLVVRDGRVALPGGPAAAPVWQRMVGTDPMSPKRFISALLRKDEGKLLAFFASLMQLDPARQKFFTISGQRAARFYELFKESPDLRMGAVVKRRSMTFSDFMRQLPLDEQGHVMFPGSPESWMVAKGQSSSVAGTARLLKRVSRVTTPDVEDEILLRLAGTAYTSGVANLSELDNFLAVAHVDAHRLQPLDEASALLLAQHYARHLEAWPYLAVLPALELDDYARFFRLSENLESLDRVAKNEVLGELSALLKILCLLFDSGRIDAQRSTLLFRGICEKFQRSIGAAAEYASASMELIRALIEAAKGTGRDSDEAIREALLEHGGSVSLEFQGKLHVLNGPEAQSAAYREVLELQKVPALAPLMDLYRLAGDLASSKGVPSEMGAAVAAAVARLPEVAVPDALVMGNEAKAVLNNCRLDRVREITTNLRKEVSKKKPNPKKLASISTELLAALNPQARLALTGILYAYYMSPRDLLVLDDPLFLRRHQFVKLDSRVKMESVWESSEMTKGRGAGSHFIGGFADFGILAGTASLSTSRQIDDVAKPVGAAIIGSLRETHWSALRETELHAVALKIRAAREWVTSAADSAGMISALSDATLGILPPSRRADLLRALPEHHWDSVWQVLTLSDLYFLGEEYLRRFHEDPVISPVLVMLRAVAPKSDPERIRWLGSNPRPLFDCSHPHLMRLAPYEYYEGFLLPGRLAVRINEFKLYLAEFVDRRGLPVGFLQAIAEPMAIELLRNLKMTMYEDWQSVLAAFAGMDDRMLQKVLERK